MRMNWIKIVMIMITINIVFGMVVNLYTSNISREDIVGYYSENDKFEYNSNKNMGIMPSILLFNRVAETRSTELKGDPNQVYYKTSQNFWNIVDGIINIGLFIGIFFEISINAMIGNVSLGSATNTTELFILSIITFIILLGNIVLIIKGIQFWANKDNS